MKQSFNAGRKNPKYVPPAPLTLLNPVLVEVWKKMKITRQWLKKNHVLWLVEMWWVKPA